jgi:hypothetical protein
MIRSFDDTPLANPNQHYKINPVHDWRQVMPGAVNAYLIEKNSQNSIAASHRFLV